MILFAYILVGVLVGVVCGILTLRDIEDRVLGAMAFIFCVPLWPMVAAVATLCILLHVLGWALSRLELEAKRRGL